MSAHQFKVGDSVVCIDDIEADELKAGETYTIKAIGTGIGWFKGHIIESVLLALHEAKGKTKSGLTHEEGFAARRFRPVQKRSTDISTLKALLNPTPEQIKALQKREREQDAEVLAEVIRP